MSFEAVLPGLLPGIACLVTGLRVGYLIVHERDPGMLYELDPALRFAYVVSHERTGLAVGVDQLHHALQFADLAMLAYEQELAIGDDQMVARALEDVLQDCAAASPKGP